MGSLVGIYEPDELEVELVYASGAIRAVVALKVADVRPFKDSDLDALEERRDQPVLFFDEVVNDWKRRGRL